MYIYIYMWWFLKSWGILSRHQGHEFRWTRPLDEALAIRQVRKTQVVEAPPKVQGDHGD